MRKTKSITTSVSASPKSAKRIKH